MAEVLRLGFAGLGMAAGHLLTEIEKLPYVRLSAAADLRTHALERFQQEFKGETFNSVEEMCQSPNVDAVYVATPHELHARHTIAALENGKHVLVEKPMALSIEDCEAMNTTAEKHRVKLMAGHTHTFDPPIRKMREIVTSGQLGKLLMINSSYYRDFMYREWTDQDVKMTHGVILNQGPHQVDIVRLLGGGMVKSLQAMTGIGDPSRPAEGHYLCYLEFEDGLPASLIMSGYAYFDTAELVWGIGEGGQPKNQEWHFEVRRAYRMLGTSYEREQQLEKRHEQFRYGKTVGDEKPYRIPRHTDGKKHQPFFGLTIVTGEKGDIRQSPDGIFLYSDMGKTEIPIPKWDHGRDAELREFYDAIVNDRPIFHDGRWGEASLEVCLGIIKSAAERREISMSHQVPVPNYS